MKYFFYKTLNLCIPVIGLFLLCTGAGAFIDAVCRLRHSGDAAQHHDQRKKQGKELTHDRNPPFFLVVRSSNLLVQLEKRITISV